MNLKKTVDFNRIKRSLASFEIPSTAESFKDLTMYKVRVGGKIRLISCWELHPGCIVLATYQIILKAKKRCKQ
jgi:hypothetical protein